MPKFRLGVGVRGHLLMVLKSSALKPVPHLQTRIDIPRFKRFSYTKAAAKKWNEDLNVGPEARKPRPYSEAIWDVTAAQALETRSYSGRAQFWAPGFSGHRTLSTRYHCLKNWGAQCSRSPGFLSPHSQDGNSSQLQSVTLAG